MTQPTPTELLALAQTLVRECAVHIPLTVAQRETIVKLRDALTTLSAREDGCPENHLPVHVAVIRDMERIGERCLDSGTCHHACLRTCFRRNGCVPLTIAETFLNDDWTLKSPKAPTAGEGK